MIVMIGWTPIILLICGFGAILIAGIVLFYFELRKERKIELGKISEIENWLEEYYPKFLKRRDEYIKNHPDYAKEPAYNEIKEIYAIEKIRFEGRKIKVLSYCNFTDITDNGETIIVKYKEHLPMTAFKKAKDKIRTLEIKKSDYLNTWFTCDELAVMKVIEIIRDDYLINIDAMNLDDDKSVRYLKRENM